MMDLKIRNQKLENSFNNYFFLTNRKRIELYQGFFDKNNKECYQGNRPSLPVKIKHDSFKTLARKEYDNYTLYELTIWDSLNNSIEIKHIYDDLTAFLREITDTKGFKLNYSSHRRFVRREVSKYFNYKNKSVKLFLDSIIYLKNNFNDVELITSDFLAHMEKFYPNQIK
jgi:hypothetical protein